MLPVQAGSSYPIADSLPIMRLRSLAAKQTIVTEKS